MAAQFLTSAPCCCTLSTEHDFNGLQSFTAKNEHVLHTLLGSGSKGYNNWMTSSRFPPSHLSPLTFLTQPDLPRSFLAASAWFLYYSPRLRKCLVFSPAQRKPRRKPIEQKLTSADHFNPHELRLRILIKKSHWPFPRTNWLQSRN